MSDQRHGWERLAGLLVDRRIQLGPQYRNRLKFAADTGLNERLISDLENARRQRYRVTSLRAVEAAYRWEPGSVQRVLDGGEPTPMTPPGGFATRSEFPPHAAEGQHGAGTSTLTEPATIRKMPAWFASELSRQGLHQETLTGVLDALRGLADHFGYTFGELLLHAGLASEQDLEIKERPTPLQSKALDEFDTAVDMIAASPLLSKRARAEVLALAEDERRKAIKRHAPGGE